MGWRCGKVLGVLALIGLLAAATLWARQARSERIARALRAEAAQAERDQKYGQAADALARYLALRPQDMDALATHAALLERLARTPEDWGKVCADYGRILQSDPARSGVRRRLAEIALSQGRYGLAESHLAVLCKATPDVSDLEMLRAGCCEGRGDFTAASAWYEKARAHEPARFEASIRLASLLREKLADPERADRVMDEMVEANARSPQAWFLRARYRAVLHLPGDEADLAKAVTLDPTADLMIDWARSLRDSRDFEGARRLLLRARQADLDDPRTYEELAEVELAAGGVGEAVAQLRAGVERWPERADLRSSLAHVLAQTGSTDELASQIERLRQAPDPSIPLGYLEAWLYVNRGDYPAAGRALKSLGDSCADRPALQARVDYLRSRCFVRAGEFDRQVTALREAVRLQPRWPMARRALASALLRQNEADEAESLYRRDVEEGGGVLSLNNLAWLCAIRGRDAPGALALIDKAIALAGRKPDLLDTRGVVLTALGRPDLALADLNESVAASPSSLTYLHIAQAHLRADNLTAASEAYRRAESAGLDPARLHPLEQAAREQLLAALGRP